jgi:hypothetical protein
MPWFASAGPNPIGWSRCGRAYHARTDGARSIRNASPDGADTGRDRADRTPGSGVAIAWRIAIARRIAVSISRPIAVIAKAGLPRLVPVSLDGRRRSARRRARDSILGDGRNGAPEGAQRRGRKKCWKKPFHVITPMLHPHAIRVAYGYQ